MFGEAWWQQAARLLWLVLRDHARRRDDAEPGRVGSEFRVRVPGVCWGSYCGCMSEDANISNRTNVPRGGGAAMRPTRYSGASCSSGDSRLRPACCATCVLTVAVRPRQSSNYHAARASLFSPLSVALAVPALDSRFSPLSTLVPRLSRPSRGRAPSDGWQFWFFAGGQKFTRGAHKHVDPGESTARRHALPHW